MNNRTQVDVGILDFSKAFDKVGHLAKTCTKARILRNKREARGHQRQDFVYEISIFNIFQKYFMISFVFHKYLI